MKIELWILFKTQLRPNDDRFAPLLEISRLEKIEIQNVLVDMDQTVLKGLFVQRHENCAQKCEQYSVAQHVFNCGHIVDM